MDWINGNNNNNVKNATNNNLPKQLTSIKNLVQQAKCLYFPSFNRSKAYVNKTIDRTNYYTDKQKRKDRVSSNEQMVVKIGIMNVPRVPFWQRYQNDCEQWRYSHRYLPDVMARPNRHPAQKQSNYPQNSKEIDPNTEIRHFCLQTKYYSDVSIIKTCSIYRVFTVYHRWWHI